MFVENVKKEKVITDDVRKILSDFYEMNHMTRITKMVIKELQEIILIHQSVRLSESQIRTWIKWEKTKRKNEGIPRSRWT